ncbi:hypothetical protein ACQCN2_18375 [Brevibacillus ginsengisoli]|uniref:hypothetical protein n=1 Tax=Brevibacillus ginsengisoli TaxID=363854 RepID=UPI003CF845CE
MGLFILIGSLLLMIIGTWKCIGILKAGEADQKEKYIWAGITALGIILFFLLKVLWESP